MLSTPIDIKPGKSNKWVAITADKNSKFIAEHKDPNTLVKMVEKKGVDHTQFATMFVPAKGTTYIL
ncbi:MAG: hypothetical protein GDA42_07350 [Ekhidna sp.]|nr:hypothetical protein [Ekhidna sp.]MBC6410258.1 hypothetical protein [Ekhidna sp.]